MLPPPFTSEIPLRRPLLFAGIFCFALCGSLQVRAGEAAGEDQIGEVIISASLPGEIALVDRLAAEFFENELRRAQTSNIEAETAAIYRSLGPAARTNFREERRNRWITLNAAARHDLRNAKVPQFENLAEEQKRPFRQTAIRKLGAPARLFARPSGAEI